MKIINRRKRSSLSTRQASGIAICILTLALGVLSGSCHAQNGKNPQTNINQKLSKKETKTMSQGEYAEVNGLKLYYEIHGEGHPLLLLHGSFGVVSGWGGILTELSKKHRVIAVELQGHGHTADIDRPLSFENMADDCAALLDHLKIKKADVFGYSMGGGVAFALAIKHPELVERLITLGAGTRATKEIYDPETYKQFKSISPETFNFPQLKDPYSKVAPDPSKWGVLVSKIVKMDDNFNGFPEKDVKSIKARTLLMMGDRDAVRVEHAVEMYRLIPNSQLAILPGGDHFVLYMKQDQTLGIISAFLDAPLP